MWLNRTEKSNPESTDLNIEPENDESAEPDDDDDGIDDDNDIIAQDELSNLVPIDIHNSQK